MRNPVNDPFFYKPVCFSIFKTVLCSSGQYKKTCMKTKKKKKWKKNKKKGKHLF